LWLAPEGKRSHRGANQKSHFGKSVSLHRLSKNRRRDQRNSGELRRVRKTMVSNLKNLPIDGVKIVPCRVNGPRGIVKSFLVTGEHRLIFVDTGFSDADADIIMDAIKDMGHEHEELKLCVLTHRHGDHTGGLKKVKKRLKFDVMGHELKWPGIQKATGYDVEHVVKGGERLPDCGGINVLHTPGHTAGHISLHLPRIKTMIAGAAIVSAGEHLGLPSLSFL